MIATSPCQHVHLIKHRKPTNESYPSLLDLLLQLLLLLLKTELFWQSDLCWRRPIDYAAAIQQWRLRLHFWIIRKHCWNSTKPCQHVQTVRLPHLIITHTYTHSVFVQTGLFPELFQVRPVSPHRHRSWVNFRGARHFCPKKYVWKINKIPEFYMILAGKITKLRNFFIFAQKINKIPKFYNIFARKCPILHNNYPKIFFSGILGGHVPSLPPVSYAYGPPKVSFANCYGSNCYMPYVLPAEQSSPSEQ